MNDEIKIEKGVPIPPRKVEARYPFEEMEVGDSFQITPKQPLSFRAYVYVHGKKLGRKFAIRKIEGGTFRIWRTQ